MNENASLVKEYFGYESHWLSTREGEQIHYLDEGPADGVPVILLHGSAIGITAAANFYLTIPALTDAGFRAIAPDLYGYGFTETAPGVTPTRPHQVDQVIRMMDALEVPSAYVLGNSLGSMVASSLALAHPGRVRGCVMVGTAGARWPQSRFEPQNLSWHQNADGYDPQMVRQALEHLVHDPKVIDERLVECRTRLAELPGAFEKYQDAIRHRELTKKEFPFRPDLAAQCPVPMLFIFGREDRVMPPEDALAAVEAFAHADLVILGHCGHWSMIERADDFNAHMLRFLSGGDRHVITPPVPAPLPAR